MHQTSLVSVSRLTLAIVRGLAVRMAELLLLMPILSNKRLKLDTALETRTRLALPLEPVLATLGMALVPKPPFFRAMPRGGAFSCLVVEVLSALSHKRGSPRDPPMLGCIKAFQVGQCVVAGIPVPVMNMALGRDRAESVLPNHPMQLLAAPRVIDLARPKAEQAAIEILRENVKDDWIAEPVSRHSADFQPLTVLNI